MDARTEAKECHPGSVGGWTPGGEFTLGAEEELLLVDDRGHLLGPQGSSVIATSRQHVPAGMIGEEIFVDEVELRTSVCTDAEELTGSLSSLRGSLAESGVVAMAVGVHPDAAFGQAPRTSSPRYDALGAEFAGLLRTPTAAFQVHVGLPDPETALAAYRGLRNRLSVFRALAAGSPYWHGRDSGLACSRAAIIRSYPRTTMPPALPSWDEYLERVDRLMLVDELADYTYVCWELRPHPRWGTVEVRVMDAQHSLARAAGLAALVQGVARHAVERPDLDDLPDEAVLANDFRACRYGLDASILDPEGSRRPMRDVVWRALEEAERMLRPDGLQEPLKRLRSMLTDPPEYARQRDLCRQHGVPALLADLVARTAQNDT